MKDFFGINGATQEYIQFITGKNWHFECFLLFEIRMRIKIKEKVNLVLWNVKYFFLLEKDIFKNITNGIFCLACACVCTFNLSIDSHLQKFLPIIINVKLCYTNFEPYYVSDTCSLKSYSICQSGR